MAKSNAVKTMEMALDVEWRQLNQAVASIEAIRAKMPEYQAKWNDLHAKALELKEAGLIYAGTHMKAGKYLYLVYPSQYGQRDRVYIGAEKEKQEEALAGIERAAEYDRTMRQIDRLKDMMNWSMDYIERAYRFLQ